jgi:hypothetical protein
LSRSALEGWDGRMGSSIQAAYLWYEEQRPGLGEDFLEAIDVAIASVLAFPEAYPIIHRDARRVLLERFPYGLYYRIAGQLGRRRPTGGLAVQRDVLRPVPLIDVHFESRPSGVVPPVVDFSCHSAPPVSILGMVVQANGLGTEFPRR